MPNSSLSQLTLPTLNTETQQIENQTYDLPSGGTAGITSISVNGVQQSVVNHAVDLDIASNLITETQWTQIGNILV